MCILCRGTAEETTVDGTPSNGSNPYIDSLTWGGAWETSGSGTAEVSVMFMEGTDPYNYGFSGASYAWTAEEEDCFETAFDLYEAVCNITFTTTTDADESDIWFWVVDDNQADGFLGWHDVPGSSDSPGEPLYGVFNADDASWSNGLDQGGYGFVTIIHELGHGVGLAHPHDGGGESDASLFPGVSSSFGDYGTNDLNQGIFTTMSYNTGYPSAEPGVDDAYGWEGTPMAFDIAALQEIYGANTSHETGDNTYTLASVNEEGTFWSCIWDAGGSDTISNANISTSSTIDLRDAPLSGSNAGGYVSQVDGIIGGFTIANGAVIENAIGGDAADTLIGNDADNVLVGGTGEDHLQGGDGDDILQGDVHADTLSGGDGTDTATYADSNEAVQIHLANNIATNGHADGDTFNSIENLIGSVYGDTLTGDTADNEINGGEGADTIDGWFGDDVIIGGAGGDFMDGGDGDDTVSYASSSSGVTVNFLNETGSGGDAAGDTVTDFEIFIGSSSDDEFTAGSFDCEAYGGDGDDTLIAGVATDTLVGGNGNDVISYAGSDAAVTVNLITSAVEGGWAEGDTISGFEGAFGSSYDDTLTGTVGDDVFDGSGGADTIYGGAGDDTIDGGDGADEIYGGDGGDTIDGGAGFDTVYYHNSEDAIAVNLATGVASGGLADGDTVSNCENLIATVYDDTIVGNDDANYIEGGDGGDTIDGGNGADEIDGGDGDDTLRGGGDADTLIGGEGTDKASYANGGAVVVSLENGGSFGDADGDTFDSIEDLIGSANDDTLSGDDNDNVIEGGAGADVMEGGEGSDTLSYEGSTVGVQVYLYDGASYYGDAHLDVISGFENLLGSDRDDKFRGDEGANVISGGAGMDEITGRGGSDTLLGGLGDDELAGGDGNDMLEGGAGGDAMNGGDGIDTVSYASSDDGVNIALSDGTANGGHADGDSLVDFENITGSNYGDILTGSADRNTLKGNSGVDSLYGQNGHDILYGDGGNDRLYGGNQNDRLYGGNQKDYLDGGNQKDALYGGNHNDTLKGGNHNDKLYGGNHNDKLYGGNHNDKLYGGNHNDKLYGGKHHDKLYGDAGNDRLYGDKGKDVLVGGKGRDFLYGGRDNDRDIFVFEHIKDSKKGGQRDKIWNFKSKKDDIDLRKIDANAKKGGNQKFKFNDDDPAANSVWFKRGMLYGDVNGNGKADFQIQLVGVKSIQSGDILL